MFKQNPFFNTAASAPEALQPGQPGMSLLVLILFAVVVGVMLRVIFGRRNASQFRQAGLRAFPKGRGFQPDFPAAAPRLSEILPADPSGQLEAVRNGNYKVRPLLNQSEAQWLPRLEALVQKHAKGHRVMAQTSLGEVLSTDMARGDAADAAFRAIHSKRLDFGVFNARGHLVVAIEHQGEGHSRNGAFVRDAVKREALRKAGVPWLEILPDTALEDMEAQLRRLLDRRADVATAG